MKRIIPLIVLLSAFCGCSCHHSAEGEGHAAPVTKQQAREMAVVAAAAIAECDHTDTLALQRAIIDAYATRSEMEMDGNSDAAEAFDNELRDELRRIDPQVAAEISP